MYRSSKYGFEIKFPESWKNYNVKAEVSEDTSGVASVNLIIPISGKDIWVYNISATPASKWSANKCKGLETECAQGEVLARSAKYVFEGSIPVYMSGDPCVKGSDDFVSDKQFCSVYKDIAKNNFAKNNFKIINQGQASDSTTGWQTYKNDQYKFTINYPKDWKIQQDTNSSAIVGFTPESIDKFPTCKKYADDLKKNGDKNAEFFARTSYCMISLSIENNPSQLSIKDYLQKTYNSAKDADVTNGINSLVVTKKDGAETTKTWQYSFIRADRSFAGGKVTPGVEREYADQFIVNLGKQIVFITNLVSDEENKPSSTFNQMITSFKKL